MPHNESNADDSARCWNQAKIFPIRSDHLYSGIRRYVKASGGVNGAVGPANTGTDKSRHKRGTGHSDVTIRNIDQP